MSKAIKTNFIIFSISLFIYNIVFYGFLHYLLDNQNYILIFPIAITYAVAIMILGIVFGFKNRKLIHTTRYDLGLIFHLITFIICNTINLVYVILFREKDSIIGTIIAIFMWSLGLGIHYFISQKTIKGENPKEIFK